MLASEIIGVDPSTRLMRVQSVGEILYEITLPGVISAVIIHFPEATLPAVVRDPGSNAGIADNCLFEFSSA